MRFRLPNAVEIVCETEAEERRLLGWFVLGIPMVEAAAEPVAPSPSRAVPDDLVLAERGRVVAIAKSLRDKAPPGVELGDLIGFGNEGLMDAARKFDPRLGSPFGAYAGVRIKGAILDGIRDASPLKRRTHERLTERADAEVTTTKAVAEGEQRHHEAAARDEVRSAEDLVIDAERLEVLRVEIEKMPREEAELLRRHYFEGERFDHIAADLGISKSWASRIHARAIEILRVRAQEREKASAPVVAPVAVPPPAPTLTVVAPPATERRRYLVRPGSLAERILECVGDGRVTFEQILKAAKDNNTRAQLSTLLKHGVLERSPGNDWKGSIWWKAGTPKLSEPALARAVTTPPDWMTKPSKPPAVRTA